MDKFDVTIQSSCQLKTAVRTLATPGGICKQSGFEMLGPEVRPGEVKVGRAKVAQEAEKHLVFTVQLDALLELPLKQVVLVQI